MSLSKLAGAISSAAQEASAKKAQKITSALADNSKAVTKNAKGSLDALAAQGRVLVKKSQEVSQNAAKKIQAAAQDFDKKTDVLAEKIQSAVDTSKKIDAACSEPFMPVVHLDDSKFTAKTFSDIKMVNPKAQSRCGDGMSDWLEKFASESASTKTVMTPDGPQQIKSAQESAEWLKSQFAFQEMIEPGLSHKNAKESFDDILTGGDTPAVAAMRDRVEKYRDKLPEVRAKKAQALRKAELKAKYGDKLELKKQPIIDTPFLSVDDIIDKGTHQA